MSMLGSSSHSGLSSSLSLSQESSNTGPGLLSQSFSQAAFNPLLSSGGVGVGAGAGSGVGIGRTPSLLLSQTLTPRVHSNRGGSLTGLGSLGSQLTQSLQHHQQQQQQQQQYQHSQSLAHATHTHTHTHNGTQAHRFSTPLPSASSPASTWVAHGTPRRSPGRQEDGK
jgi:uncharacterized membrane protein YebE (DUF533 family)